MSMITSAIFLPIFVMFYCICNRHRRLNHVERRAFKACLISAEEASKAIDMEKAQNLGLNNFE